MVECVKKTIECNIAFLIENIAFKPGRDSDCGRQYLRSVEEVAMLFLETVIANHHLKEIFAFVFEIMK